MTATSTGTSLSRAETAIVAALAALLPAGFRDRQRGEWTGDLLSMAGGPPAARRRYLAGAARTILSLRSQARGAGDAPEFAMPFGIRDTVARVLLLGLLWPMLSWLLWVPLRYYVGDIPGRLAAADHMIQIDPQTVWPMDRGPGWLAILWAVPHLGAWATVIGGPTLVAAITVVGSVAALVRHGHHPVHLPAVAPIILPGVPAALALAALSSDYTNLVVGLAAVAAGATARNLSRRARAVLIALGLITLTVFLSWHTAPGQDMMIWFQD